MKDLEGIVTIPIKSRPLLVMSCDRHRSGTQWVDRDDVQAWCRNRTFCMDPSIDATGSDLDKTFHLDHKHFLQHIASVPFVAYVHGGGLDPSPKAWEIIL
jgi:hypothetical protein